MSSPVAYLFRSILVWVSPGIRLRWDHFPEFVRRSLCAAYLQHSIDAPLLTQLERVREVSAFDQRLVALCIKGYCDRHRYVEAYSLLEHEVSALCRTTLSKLADRRLRRRTKKWLQPFVIAARSYARMWQHVDRESRKDTAARNPRSVTLLQCMAELLRQLTRVAPKLPDRVRTKLLFVLLDLARATADEEVVAMVAQLFVETGKKDDIATYGKFIRILGTETIYSRNLETRQDHLSEFRACVAKKIPDERALFRLVNQRTAARKLEVADKGHASQERRAYLFALLDALDLAGFEDVVFRVAQRLVERRRTPAGTIRYCLHVVRLRSTPAAALGYRVLRETCEHVKVTPENVRELLTANLVLCNRQQIADLERQGWLHRRYGHDDYDLASAFSLLGRFDASKQQLLRLKRDSAQEFATSRTPRSMATALDLETLIDDHEFLLNTNAILNEVPQPSRLQGLVVLIAKNAHELNVFPILALRELKQRGFAVVSLVSGLLTSEPMGIAEIDDVAGQLNRGMDHARWQDVEPANAGDEWRIDIPARLFAYRGTDVYWGVREDLTCRLRRYSIDFSEPSKRSVIDDNMRRIEMFEVCVRRIAEIGRRLDIPVRLLLPYVHLGSHYYARRYVQSLADTQDIAVVHVANAYENYFTNFRSESATTLAVRDMTRHRDLAGAYFAPPDSFEAYYESLPDSQREHLVEEVAQWTTQHRVQRADAMGDSARLAFLADERRLGKKIVGLFGKVLFDLEMPAGDGPAHADMREWFDHTLAIASANPHLHLVIKPHPHEVREEIALYATEFLTDWMPEQVPSNVHFLGHDEFNLFELAEVLDLALLWNGTAALELGVLNIPTLIGAYYGHINYPVGHTLPQSRDEYEQLVSSRHKLPVAPDVRLRSAALIAYFRHPDHSIPYRYTHRGLTNRSIRNLHWLQDDLRDYRLKGDAYVTKIADRIVGVDPTDGPGVVSRDRSQVGVVP